MVTIGITGGVGCGKSMILAYIKEHYNCRIILADDVANKLKEPGEVCYEAIVKLLGDSILDENGYIDRKSMAKEIFADDRLLDEVNAIVHPAVKDYILDAIENEKKSGIYDFLFIEAALLIECGYKAYVDEMWYIYAEEAVRRYRLKKQRGYSDVKIDSIMEAQLSEEEFRSGSDFCIDNSGSPEETYRQIAEKMKGYVNGR